MVRKRIPKPYRSGLEYRLHTNGLKGCLYEPCDVPYTTKRKYKVDFVPMVEGGCNVIIEAKGRFFPGDLAKYKAVRDSNPHLELVFVFSHPTQKVRKGAKLSMAQWAEKEGFRWYTEETCYKILEALQDE